MAEPTSTCQASATQRQVVIYALTDADGNIRYVGKTARSVNGRLAKHIDDAKRGTDQSHRCRWIRKQLSAGRSITISVLEHVEGPDWQSREQFWIKFYRDQGCRLTNTTAGGDGLHGMTFTAEHRAKIGASNKGRKASPESLKKMSQSHKGFRHKESSRRLMSMQRRGVPKSPEHVAAVNRSNEHRNRPIFRVSTEGVILSRYPSVKEAAKAMGVYHHGINAAALWPGRSCKGFKWMYCDQAPKQLKLWGNLPPYVPRKRGRPFRKSFHSSDAGHPGQSLRSSRA